MQCPRCQFDNPEDAKFCIECGSAMEFHCPKCGAITPATGKFCKECGHGLEQPPEPSPVDYSQPQSYTPKFLADKILTSRSSIEGERKLVTVLFADVANYTAMAEKLDPEEVHQIMDGCFKILMDEIHRYEGTINQFTGDGVMALFGAPVAHEDHAQRACHAALSIQRAIGEYRERVKKETTVDFEMRIGLNAGPVIVGSIGDDLRMDYTAVGDTTNLAARMEEHAEPGTIIVSRDTHRLVREYFEVKPLGEIGVKGKGEPQEAFELVKPTEVATRFEAAVSRGLTRFVGRRNSMAALMEAWEKAQSGSGQVVGIVGEAGVGKSRLLLEFRNRLPQSEFTYLEGRCLHFGGSMPYLPILDILRSYFDIKEDDREYLIKKKLSDKTLQLGEGFQTALPSFQEILSLKVEDAEYLALEPKAKRERVFEAIRDLLIRASQHRPLIAAIEDLHWMDKTSEDFLDYVIGWLANVRVLLILLYRPEYTHQWGSKSYYNRIGLDQLTMKSSAELVQAILEGGEVVSEIRELILNRAAGNPLFMEEFTHTLIENGSIQCQDNQYILTRKASDIKVPDTIQGIIAARMDRLEESLKRIMQLASVIGRDFAFRILQAITGMRDELKSHLLNLQGLEFIYEKSLFPELEYIFKHALIQEVAYNSLLQKRRKEIHEKIGMAIEAIYVDKLEQFYEMLAYHYSSSENLEKTLQFTQLAAEKAIKNYSTLEAYRFCEDATKTLDQLPPTEENKRILVDVLNLMVIPMRLLGRPEGSLRLLKDGETIARELGDRRSLSKVYGTLSMNYLNRGDMKTALEYAEKCYAAACETREVELMAPAAVAFSSVLGFQGHCSRIADVVPGVLDLLEKTKRKPDFFGCPFNPYSELLGWYGVSVGLMGSFDEAMPILERGLSFAKEINHLPSVGMLEWWCGSLLMHKGEAKEGMEHIQNSLRLSEESEVMVFRTYLYYHLGQGYHLMGDLGTAQNYMHKGIEIQTEVGFGVGVSFCNLLLAKIYFDAEDLGNARSHVEEALRLSKKNHEYMFEAMSLISLGRILGRADPSEKERAESLILSGIGILKNLQLRPLYAQGYLDLGAFYAGTGQTDKALENLKRAESMFQEMGMDYWLAKAQEVLGRL